MGRIMKDGGIVCPLLVPPFDFVGDDRNLFQGHAVKKTGNLATGFRFSQACIGDRAYDLVSNRSISRPNRRAEKIGKSGYVPDVRTRVSHSADRNNNQRSCSSVVRLTRSPFMKTADTDDSA